MISNLLLTEERISQHLHTTTEICGKLALNTLFVNRKKKQCSWAQFDLFEQFWVDKCYCYFQFRTSISLCMYVRVGTYYQHKNKNKVFRNVRRTEYVIRQIQLSLCSSLFKYFIVKLYSTDIQSTRGINYDVHQLSIDV